MSPTGLAAASDLHLVLIHGVHPFVCRPGTSSGPLEMVADQPGWRFPPNRATTVAR
jgi:hypothetical protein